jgi:TolB protein
MIKKMKKLSLLILTIFYAQANDVTLTVSGAQQTQMPIAIMVLDGKNNELNDIATIIKKDLQFTDQFKVNIKKCDANTAGKVLKKNIQNLCDTGTPLALCISKESKNGIAWRLYDTMQCTMICGKKYSKKSAIAREWAHAIADETLQTLTGNKGFFSSRIAYCKDSKNNKGQTLRKIYIADFDGSNEELLVDLPTIAIAPRWHSTKPHILYSEYADTNIELMSITMKKKRKPVANFDGINMLATYSPDGKSYSYCSSRASGSCQIYLVDNGNLKRCTHNSGNNTSPIFIDAHHLCFCSDFQKGNPQIYIGNLKTGHLQRITHGGYCTTPSYCPKNHKIAYHKMINGTMQVMVYDCTTKAHAQLTKSAGNKHEASWSPDGTHLLFAHEVPDKNSQLCILNMLTRTTKYITSAQDICSYPHWGPTYQTFPVIT